MSILSCKPSAVGSGPARPASVAGRFYPSSPDTLQAEVDGFLAEAGVEPAAGVRAVIAPHAGYVFSGAMAAKAFARIQPGASYSRVFLLGPSHRAAFDGASVELGYGALATPLGRVPVDTALCRSLTEADSVFAYVPEAHDGEHCLEVQLPFLQTRLDSVPPVVPVIIGTQDLAKLRRVTEALRPYFTADNLFVVSSDFSHYPAYADAVSVDSATGRAISTGSLHAFLQTIAANASRRVRGLATSACGQAPIAVLLMLTEGQPGLRVEHLGYCNSGDSPHGSRGEVVGYHAFAVTGADATASGAFSLTAAEKATLLAIARRTIADSLGLRHTPAAGEAPLTPALRAACGAFVTLNEHGRLRGCIGSLTARRPLHLTVEAMAAAAAFEDPRFRPVTAAEFDDIDIEISVLSPLRRISSAAEFEPGRHGILIVRGAASGTFLPQVARETGWTREELLGHCARDKAGIGWNGWRDAELYVYEAEVFGEKDNAEGEADGRP